MSTGTPLSLKCPKCKRGKYSYPRQIKGVRPTGRVEERITQSAHAGHGCGGPRFVGHRGEVECLDCGHVWFSTHYDSGRRALTDEERTVRAVKRAWKSR